MLHNKTTEKKPVKCKEQRSLTKSILFFAAIQSGILVKTLDFHQTIKVKVIKRDQIFILF